MPEKAVISHRGEKYEIGRGRRFYGIWVAGAPYEAPVDRWPENRDGWQQAWSRFASIETPGTITAVTRERRGLPPGLAGRLRLGGARGGGADEARPHGGVKLLVGEALLVLGVVLGLVGLFPAYSGGQSLLSQWEEVVPHLCYVIGWAATAALVALSVAKPSSAARYGALFGLGVSAVTLGLFLGDVGQVTSGQASLGSGLVISLVGWLFCTVGAALALAAGAGHSGQHGQRSRPGRPTLAHAGPLALLVLAGIGTAASFAPSWDSYTLASATAGTQTITAGNAFDSPGLVITGNVLVMVAIVVVAVIAVLWRPPRQGATLLAGAIVPLAAELASAIIQVSQPATPAMFGISPAAAAAAGLTISSDLTGAFWVFFVFVISLLVSCAWLFTEAGPSGGIRGVTVAAPAQGDQPGPEASPTVVTEGANSDAESPSDADNVPDSGADSVPERPADSGVVSDDSDSRVAESGAGETGSARRGDGESGAADSGTDTPPADGEHSAYA